MSSHPTFITSNLTLLPSLNASKITVRAPLNSTSTTISTASGTTFIDNTTSKTVTGFITVSSNATDSNIWNIQRTFKYNDFAEIERLYLYSLEVRSTIYISGNLEITGNISSMSTLITSDFTQKGVRIPTVSTLASTVAGLGSAGYISSGLCNVRSTVEGLGSIYISTGGLRSTVVGLGSIYISSGYSLSSIFNNEMFITSSNVSSTIDGLGTYYISTPSVQSTINGISSIYVPATSCISTISSFIFNEEQSLASTVKNLGVFYISSPSLQSTVNGLGNFYLSSAQVHDYVVNADCNVSEINLSNMVVHMGSYGYISTVQLVSTVESLLENIPLDLVKHVETLGYISSTQLISTVRGLSPTYISTPSLQSTVQSIQFQGGSFLTSTVAGLGSASYVSLPSVISTISSLSNAYSSTLRSFFVNLGLSYISSPHLISTVRGLTPPYISTASFLSTSHGYTSYGLDTIVNGANSIYISTPTLLSTTSGLVKSFSNDLLSTTNGLGTTYISSPHLISTVNGLGSYSFISSASLVSSAIQYINYEKLQLQLMVNNAGNTYISTSRLVSTTTGLLNTFSNQVFSTAVGFGTTYISSPHLISTVRGLGSASYISTRSLVSTYVYYTSFENKEIRSMVNNSGQTYTSTNRLTNITSILSNEFANGLASTMVGLKNYSYISYPQLISTVNNLSLLSYITAASLISSTAGYNKFTGTQLSQVINDIGQTYISRGGLISTTSGLLLFYTRSLTSTVNGLGSASYISRPQLISSVRGLQTPPIPFATFTSNMRALITVNSNNMVTQRVNNSNLVLSEYVYYLNFSNMLPDAMRSFSNSLISTGIGLGSLSFVSSSQIVSTVRGLGQIYISTDSLISTSAALELKQIEYIQNLTLSPTVYITKANLITTTASLLTSFTRNITSTQKGLGTASYISTAHLVSTVRGLDSIYITPLEITSTLNSITPSYAEAAIKLFENTLGQGYTVGQGYISTPALVSTVAGLSNIYILSQRLESTINGLGTAGYISAPSILSTIISLSNSQRVNGVPALTSTVNGLGSFGFLSSVPLRLEVSEPLTQSVDYCKFGLVPIFDLYENGYMFSLGGGVITNRNFYEESNLSKSHVQLTAAGFISADIVRSIEFGQYYMYGGSMMTIGSDSNLKENISRIVPSQALHQVESLRGVYYKKVGDSNSYIGCIAQEVEEVFPEVITTHNSVEPKELKSMKYEFLLAPLVESVKELIQINSTVKYFVRKNQGNIQ